MHHCQEGFKVTQITDPRTKFELKTRFWLRNTNLPQRYSICLLQYVNVNIVAVKSKVKYWKILQFRKYIGKIPLHTLQQNQCFIMKKYKRNGVPKYKSAVEKTFQTGLGC